jgi:hypothetical protein
MSSLASSTTSKEFEGQSPKCGFSPEFNFLLACCAAEVGGARSQELRACLDRPLMWDRVRELASGIPSAIMQEWHAQYENNARRNLRFTAELFRILDCLNTHGVEAIPFKGPMLAEAAYGDLALRCFSDLDILVRPADVPRAKAALRDLNFMPSSPLSETVEHYAIATGYEFAFDGPNDRNLLEIQWNILPRFYAIDFDIEEVFRRSEESELSGRKVRTLCPDDLFLVLCAHAAKHGWLRLGWLCDIGGLMKRQRIRWARVEVRARELGIQRIVGVSVWLAYRLLALDVNESVLRVWRGDPEIERLAEIVMKELPGSEEYDPESARYFRLMLRLRERKRDRLRFLLRLALTPSVGEWSALKLPAPLFPLYRVIRVGRLAARAVGIKP